jgi:hypothetical protein
MLYQRVISLFFIIGLLSGCTGVKRLPSNSTPVQNQPLAIIDRQVAGLQAVGQLDDAPQTTDVTNRIFLPSVMKPLQVPVLPPGKLPVDGGHTFPRWTKSYYMMSIDPSANFNLGCELGLLDLNTPGVQDNLVLLDYGSPKQVNGVPGASLLMVSGFASNQQIAVAVQNFGWGYYVCTGNDMLSRLRIGIGTTNYPTSTNPAVTYQHGLAWANMVNQVNAWLTSNTTNSITQQVDAVGANDIELAWNSYANTREWLDGYDAVNGYVLYNFGALPGCPYFSRPGSQCGSYPYIWSKEQVWYVIYGAGPVYSLPEIYARNGVNAEQWYLMSVYAYTTHGAPVGFVGSLTTYTACLQVGGCGTGNSAINNSPFEGWTQLYTLLNGDPRTAQGLRWASDMVWTNRSGLVDSYSLPSDQTEGALPDEKELYLQQALQQSLQNPNLSADARRSLQEKLDLAVRTVEPVTPASKDRPNQLQQAGEANSPLLDTSETIVEGSEGLVRPSEAAIANVWSGVLNDRYVQVLAGSFPENPEQGLVIVISLANGSAFAERQVLYGPSYTGQLRIVERIGDDLILKAVNGQTLRFDLLTLQLH